MIRRFIQGEALTAARLNETIDAVNALSPLLPGRVREEVESAKSPLRATADANDEAGASDDTDDPSTDDEAQADAPAPGTFVWTLLAKSEQTQRLTDPDDTNTYVDVKRKTGLTFIDQAGNIYSLTLE